MTYKFTELEMDCSYDIVDGGYAQPRTLELGMQGAAAMAADWPPNAEAWMSGEEDFAGNPVEFAAAASPPAQDCPICLRWCRVRGSLVEHDLAAELAALDRRATQAKALAEE